MNIPSSTYGKILSARRDDRVDEGACLENRLGASPRGFESHSLRHFIPGKTVEYGEVPEWLIGLAC